EVARKRRDRRAPTRAIVEAGADKRLFRPGGAPGRRRHAAVGDARRGDSPPLEGEAKRAHHRGNVLVDALADLERAIGLTGGEARREKRAHVFAAPAILLAVGEEE